MAPEVWTVGRLLQWTADYLKGHGSESPRLDAEVLLAHALNCQRIELYTTFEETPKEEQRSAFRELVRRRAEGTPVAYLVGRREFYSLPFRVTPDVLIPRPETELLVIAVLDLVKEEVASEEGREERGEGRGEEQSSKVQGSMANVQAVGDTAAGAVSADQNPPSSVSACGLHIADIGTGSGIIAVCLAKHLPNCRVTAVDISPAALAVARENAEKHGVADRIKFVESNLFAAVPADRQFDFIVSNPPYIKTAEMEELAVDVRKYEPRIALEAGPRGTEVIEPLISQAAECLRPGGYLLMEISPAIHDAVRALLEADHRLEVCPTIKDLARLPRVVQARAIASAIRAEKPRS